MTTIDQLINLNIELEGALRVLRDRPTDEALAMVQEKYVAFSAAFDEYGRKKEEQPDEVKDDEAVAGEEEPGVEPSEFKIPAGAAIVESDEEAVAVAHAESQAPDIRRNLTINDRFLFKRELFHGSDEDFNGTLDLIAAMHSLEEAEEYIYDDLAWDRNDPAVKEFQAFIANYFTGR